jgi:hypothetical protein
VVLPIREEEPPRTPNSSFPPIHTKYGPPWKSPISFVMPEEDKTFNLKLD